MKIFPRAAALAKKELFSYAGSPAFWGLAVFFLLFCSIWLFYFERFFDMDAASLRSYFAAFPIAFIFVIPALTMKSWAEERKTGSIELLLTLPFSEWDLVLGKFAAILAMIAAMLALTLPLPLSLLPLGNFDGGVIFAEYLGAFLLGASASALGLFLSGLSKNQAGSFLGSAAVLMTVMLVNRLAAGFALPFPLVSFFNYISLSFHFESFTRGLIDIRDLLFFVLSASLFLYLNTRVLVSGKWK
ncbi:MAG: ABC transporter permease subunit [Treponema sp.]|nr:ABC transporter permease subunit [Treponema sp.]